MNSITPFSSLHKLDDTNQPIQNSLSSLWSRIEKKQKRNQKFFDDKNNLFNTFNEKVLPVEQQQGQKMIELFEFLIPFLSRKTLSEYQRNELIDWIEHTLDYLCSHPFLGKLNVEALKMQYDEALSVYMSAQPIDKQEIDYARANLERMFDGQLKLTDDEIAELIQDPSLLNQYVQQIEEVFEREINSEDELGSHQEKKAKEHEKQSFEDFFERDFESDSNQTHSSDDFKHRELDRLFKAGQLNKLYKRLASRLHPDKEPDPAKKQHKHMIMQILSEARRSKDVYTLIQLYQTHINDGEFDFDTNTLHSMQILLKEKLKGLDEELYQAKNNNDLSTLVWRKFSGRSKKKTQTNIQEHITNLEFDVLEKQSIMLEYKTVSKMKQFLQARVEENRQLPIDEWSLDLADLLR